MATVKLYLKDSRAKSETLIYLSYQYDSNRFKYSTGQKIRPQFWNSDKQSVKKSFTGSMEINNILNGARNSINEIHRTALIEGIIVSNEYFRAALKKSVNKKEGKRKSFFDCLDEFSSVALTRKGEQRKPNTLKKFTSLKNHLLSYQAKYKKNISFETINTQFYQQFVSFLREETEERSGLLNNSVGRYISAIKTFLKWASHPDRGYNKFDTFHEFQTFSEDADIIYLTYDELMNLYSFDFKGNTRLQQVRDVFCFGCFTGLRYSDIAQIRKSNLKGEEIHFKTQKTKDSLIVPLNEFALEILQRNNFQLPVISNQKTNKYIKEIGELVGIDEEIILTKYRGVEEVKFKEPKYKFITVHTSRRTFVTLSLEQNMRAETVMSITGHKDYKTFKKYIKITSKVKLVEMKQVWNRPAKLSVVS